jgi:hypothetical protein
LEHRGAVLADGVLIGSWQLQCWVAGRPTAYTAWLDDGQKLLDATMEGLTRKIQRVPS